MNNYCVVCNKLLKQASNANIYFCADINSNPHHYTVDLSNLQTRHVMYFDKYTITLYETHIAIYNKGSMKYEYSSASSSFSDFENLKSNEAIQNFLLL